MRKKAKTLLDVQKELELLKEEIEGLKKGAAIFEAALRRAEEASQQEVAYP